jgi:hypothetical protein
VTGELWLVAIGPTFKRAHPVAASGASVCGTVSVFVKVTLEPGTTQAVLGDTPALLMVTVAAVPSVQPELLVPVAVSLPQAASTATPAPHSQLIARRMFDPFLESDSMQQPAVHYTRPIMRRGGP